MGFAQINCGVDPCLNLLHASGTKTSRFFSACVFSVWKVSMVLPSGEWCWQMQKFTGSDSTFRGVLQLTIIICVRYDYVKNLFLSKSLRSWKRSRRLSGSSTHCINREIQEHEFWQRSCYFYERVAWCLEENTGKNTSTGHQVYFPANADGWNKRGKSVCPRNVCNC